MAAALNPQTKLLEMRRQMFSVQQQLEQGKKAAIVAERAFADKEARVRERDLELQATFMKMDSLVQENNAKRDRAERRAADEGRTAAGKGREISEGLAALQLLKAEVADLERARGKLQKHHDFLAHFQQQHREEFPDAASVMERFRTLQAAQRDLLAEQGRLLEEVEHKRRELARLQKARSTHALNAENVTGKIRDRVEAARAAAIRVLQGADDATVERAKGVSELGVSLQSVNNLFQRCRTGPYGGTIKHHGADAEVLGVGAGNLGEALGFAPWATPGAEEGVGGGGGGGGGGGAEGKEGESKEDSGAGAGASVEELTGMAPAAIVEKMRKALSSLIVVGSYLVDYEAIAKERGAWLEQQRRQREEKEAAVAAAAAEEAEKVRAKEQRQAAAAAAAAAAKGGASAGASPVKSAAAGAGGVGASAGAGAAGASAAPPFSPMKTGGGAGAGAGAGDLLSVISGAAAGSGVGGGSAALQAAAAAALEKAAAQGGVAGLGPKLAAAYQKQGAKAYVLSESVRLPAKIDAQVPKASSRLVAILTNTAGGAADGRAGDGKGGAKGKGGAAASGLGASTGMAAGGPRADDDDRSTRSASTGTSPSKAAR